MRAGGRSSGRYDDDVHLCATALLYMRDNSFKLMLNSPGMNDSVVLFKDLKHVVAVIPFTEVVLKHAAEEKETKEKEKIAKHILRQVLAAYKP